MGHDESKQPSSRDDHAGKNRDRSSDRPSGWSDVLDEDGLDGKPGDHMDVVHQGASSHDVASTYLEISPNDIGRKQDFRGGAPPGSGDLRLPLPQQGKLLGTAQTSGAPLAGTIKPEMFNEMPAAVAPRSGIPLVPLLVGLVLVGGVGGGVAALTLYEPEPPPPPVGSLTVTSEPPGATVFVDGQETPHRTPAEVPGLLVAEPHRVSVELPGYRPFPAETEFRVPEGSHMASVSFTLKKTLVFEIETAPTGADVYLNGKSLGVTPRKLPPMVIGESAEIELDLDGHLRAAQKVVAEEGVELRRVYRLTPAREIDVVTEPAGAEVTVDGQAVGKTPVYDVKVPSDGRYEVAITKAGYKPWKTTVKARKAPSEIKVELQQLPLMSMPLRPEERSEAKRLDAEMSKARASLARARKNLERVERTLKTVTSDPKFMFGDRARAEKAFDEASALVEEKEQALSDAQVALDQFRSEVTARFAQE